MKHILELERKNWKHEYLYPVEKKGTTPSLYNSKGEPLTDEEWERRLECTRNLQSQET